MLTYFRASPGTYPATRPIRVTEPTFVQEPVNIVEARKQVGLGEDVDYHDEDLKLLVSSARDQVEHDTGVICFTGSFTWKPTDFPCVDYLPIYGARPVTAIGSITYVDTSGATQTWSSSYYSLNTGSLVPLIQLGYAQVWPVVRGDIEGITITLTAGYASVAVIPAKIKAAVKLKLHELWKLRMGEDTDDIVKGYERQVTLIRRDDYA
jgi:uncharacterized phiE125 gp8 family phage protein